MVELAPEISLRPLPLSGDDASNRTSQNLRIEAEDKGPLWAAIENQSPSYINIRYTHTHIYIYTILYNVSILFRKIIAKQQFAAPLPTKRSESSGSSQHFSMWKPTIISTSVSLGQVPLSNHTILGSSKAQRWRDVSDIKVSLPQEETTIANVQFLQISSYTSWKSLSLSLLSASIHAYRPFHSTVLHISVKRETNLTSISPSLYQIDNITSVS